MKYNEYVELQLQMENLVYGGMNALNPIVRSICRKLQKLYKEMSKWEREMVDDFMNLPFH